MACPWNLDLRSLKIIGNGIIRQIDYDTIGIELSNDDLTLYHSETARYWSKIAIFSYHTCILHSMPLLGGPKGSTPRPNIAITFLAENNYNGGSAKLPGGGTVCV